MVRGAGLLWLGVFVVASLQPAAARPEYLARYQADPQRRAEMDGCTTCHVATTGGGARNEFGLAFDAAAREITPLLRAGFPKHFEFQSAKLPNGVAFHFADPTGKFLVLERDGQRTVVDISSLAAPAAPPLPKPENRMSFFVSSAALPSGGAFGGLAGGDRHCQDLAKAAGSGEQTWRAYLSTSFKGQPAINAGDRIGAGPWFNAKGQLVARGPVDLHAKARVQPELFLTEKGEPLAADDGSVLLTGTQRDGTAAPDKSCGNWTEAGEGEAVAGDPTGVWNSGRSVSCAADLKPRVYCFALRSGGP